MGYGFKEKRENMREVEDVVYEGVDFVGGDIFYD